MTGDPEEDDAVILKHPNVHFPHLVVRHGAVRQVLMDLPLHIIDILSVRHRNTQHYKTMETGRLIPGAKLGLGDIIRCTVRHKYPCEKAFISVYRHPFGFLCCVANCPLTIPGRDVAFLLSNELSDSNSSSLSA